MEGFSECDAWTNRLNDWYESDGFKQEAVGANKFFQNISGLLGNRPATLENAWNIFDVSADSECRVRAVCASR